jgi:hypothetical protein
MVTDHACRTQYWKASTAVDPILPPDDAKKLLSRRVGQAAEFMDTSRASLLIYLNLLASLKSSVCLWMTASMFQAAKGNAIVP